MTFSDSITTILHPITVHFPVALIIVSAALAIIYAFRKHDPLLNGTLRLLVILAAISAWVAIFTGSFTSQLSGEAHTIREVHHTFAGWTSYIISIAGAGYLFFSFYKKHNLPKWLQWTPFVFLLIAAIMVSITGYYGGYIVYNILL